MTDKEIEKGLQCCVENNCGFDCPYCDANFAGVFHCSKKNKDALDYINRLKAKIMHLELLVKGNNELIRELKQNIVCQKDQIRKERAKEILQDLKGLLEGYIDRRTYETLYVQKCKQYGVEVDE